VRCNLDISTLFTLFSGVPQGSVLGLLLFMLYTADLFSVIKSHSLVGSDYVDDTQLYGSYKYSDNAILGSTIVRCIEEIISRTSSSRLKLNPQKTEPM